MVIIDNENNVAILMHLERTWQVISTLKSNIST